MHGKNNMKHLKNALCTQLTVQHHKCQWYMDLCVSVKCLPKCCHSISVNLVHHNHEWWDSSKYAWIKAKTIKCCFKCACIKQTDESNEDVLYQYAGVWSTFKLFSCIFMVLAGHKIASLKLAILGIQKAMRTLTKLPRYVKRGLHFCLKTL